MPNNQVYDIDLSLGFKTFRIHFAEFDEPVDIMFNPSDIDFSKRFFEAKKRIDEATKNIGDFKIDENGLPETDDYIEKINGINRIIAESIDFAFGNKISDKLFSHCSPLSMPNGELFIIQFFDKITPVIQQIAQSDREKAEKNINKYVNKYKK